jgi:hypothetical protein
MDGVNREYLIPLCTAQTETSNHTNMIDNGSYHTYIGARDAEVHHDTHFAVRNSELISQCESQQFTPSRTSITWYSHPQSSDSETWFEPLTEVDVHVDYPVALLKSFCMVQVQGETGDLELDTEEEQIAEDLIDNSTEEEEEEEEREEEEIYNNVDEDEDNDDADYAKPPKIIRLGWAWAKEASESLLEENISRPTYACSDFPCTSLCGAPFTVIELLMLTANHPIFADNVLGNPQCSGHNSKPLAGAGLLVERYRMYIPFYREVAYPATEVLSTWGTSQKSTLQFP